MALAMITGGILGNLYDRLGLPGLVWPPGTGHPAGEPVFAVRDWLHFKVDGLVDWPIFNIADSLLVCGAALLVWHALRSPARRPPPWSSRSSRSGRWLNPATRRILRRLSSPEL